MADQFLTCGPVGVRAARRGPLVIGLLLAVSPGAAAVSATAAAETARPAAAFSGKVCSLVSAGQVAADGVSAGCKALGARHSATFKNVWTANYGTVGGPSGADHYLGIQVTQFANHSLLAQARGLIALEISSGRAQAMGAGGAFSIKRYTGGGKGGYQALATFIASGYAVQVTLFDKTTPPRPSQSTVQSHLLETVSYITARI